MEKDGGRSRAARVGVPEPRIGELRQPVLCSYDGARRVTVAFRTCHATIVFSSAIGGAPLVSRIVVTSITKRKRTSPASTR